MNLITFLTIVRNDNYYLDFVERIQRTLNLNLLNLNELGFLNKVEFLFIDWGSDRPLHKYIMIEERFKRNVKFINVDKKNSKKRSSSSTKFFNHSLAWNIGIKSSKSKYVILSSSDQFFDVNSWKNIISLCEKTNTKLKNYYLIPRKIIEYSLYQKSLSDRIFLDLLLNFSSTYYPFKAHNYYVGGGFATMCSKENFIKLKGMIEYPKIGISNDFELYLRSHSYNFCKINLMSLGVFFYKFPPLQNSLRNKLVYSKDFRITPKLDRSYNLANWGKIDQNIKFLKPTLIKNNIKNKKITISIKNLSISLNIFKILKNLNYFFINFNDLKKTFVIMELIDKSDCISFFEYGFDNYTRINLIGSYYKYLNIICYDNNKKNKNYGYLNRLYKSSNFFNQIRYGKFLPLINNKKINFLSAIKINSTEHLTNLIVFNKYEKNNYEVLKNINFNLLFSFSIFFSITSKNKYFLKNKFFKNSKVITLDHQSCIFINNRVNDADFEKIKKLIIFQYNKSYFIPYIRFLVYLLLKKCLSYFRFLFYKIIN
jgi:hypothetical protein